MFNNFMERFIKHIDHVARVVLYIPNEFVLEVIAPSLKLRKDQENFLELSRETELKVTRDFGLCEA